MENKLLSAKKDKFGLYEAALASLLFIIYNVVFVFGYRLAPLSIKKYEFVTYIVTFLLEGLFALTSLTVACGKKIDIKKASGLDKKFNGRIVGLGFLISVVALFCFGNLTNVFLSFLSLCGYTSILSDFAITSFWQYLIYVIISCVTPAFCEELLFRGTILAGLKKHGIKIAVIVSSIIFTLMHGNAEQTVHQMIVGMIVGYLFYKTGNLWIGIIVHFFNNFISVTQAYIISNLPAEEAIETAAATGGTAWLSLLVSLVVALAFAYFGLYLFKMLAKKVIDESNKLNGETTPENLAEIVVDGKPEYVEMTVEKEETLGEETQAQGATSVIAKETQKLPISVIVMFCLSGIYLICEWVSALALGFGI
ncbi:MAG: CPBP family intramembrane metalloprotease [Clostridia bacterium]|nr:CPBP family intramembrane metalloprotease [Clostridia bacterium]